MNPAVLVKVMQGLQVVAIAFVEGEQLALQIKSHFELDPNFKASITTLNGDAVNSDDATIDEVNAWRQSVGLAPMQKSS